MPFSLRGVFNRRSVVSRDEADNPQVLLKPSSQQAHEELLKRYLIRRKSVDKAELDSFNEVEEDWQSKDKFIVPVKSSFRKWWYRCIGIMTLWNLFCIPFFIAFGDDIEQTAENGGWMAIEYLIDFVFLFNIFFNSRLAYIDEITKVEIRNIRAVQHRYFHSVWFPLDILSVVPFEFIFPFSEGRVRFQYLLKFPHVFRFTYIWRYFIKGNRRQHEDANFKQLFKIFCFILVCCHWLSCFWFFIVSSQPVSVYDWLDSSGLRGAGAWEKYTTSLYAGLKSIVGQDIFPQTNAEKVVATFLLLGGAALHATIFGNIAIIMQRMNSFALKHQEKMDSVTEAMRHLNLPRNLQERIRLYHEYCHSHQQGDAYKQFITELSRPLQTEIRLFMLSDMLQNTWLFSQVDPAVLREVVMKLEDETYLPGDYIVRFNDRGQEMFFIVKGNCEVLSPSEDLLRTLTAGAYFGEVALLMTGKRTASVRALSYCSLAKLTKEALDEIVKTFPEYAKKLREGLDNYIEFLHGGENEDGTTGTKKKMTKKMMKMVGAKTPQTKLTIRLETPSQQPETEIDKQQDPDRPLFASLLGSHTNVPAPTTVPAANPPPFSLPPLAPSSPLPSKLPPSPSASFRFSLGGGEEKDKDTLPQQPPANANILSMSDSLFRSRAYSDVGSQPPVPDPAVAELMGQQMKMSGQLQQEIELMQSKMNALEGFVSQILDRLESPRISSSVSASVPSGSRQTSNESTKNQVRRDPANNKNNNNNNTASITGTGQTTRRRSDSVVSSPGSGLIRSDLFTQSVDMNVSFPLIPKSPRFNALPPHKQNNT